MSWRAYFATVALICLLAITINMLCPKYLGNGPIDPRNDKYSEGQCP